MTTAPRSGRPMLARLVTSLITAAFATPASAQPPREIDVVQLFGEQHAAGRTGLARKTRLVDARPAKIGEIVVTIIAGEGKETQSPPASTGDMVVRNRCPETGNEQILVAAAKFAPRYEGPVSTGFAPGWDTYRPRGKTMRYFIVPMALGIIRFTAPWGESMVPRPGDAIVQDPEDTRDTYRIAAAAFKCTYEITQAAAE